MIGQVKLEIAQVIAFKLKAFDSGEGGIVTTDNDQLAEKIRQIQSLGYAGIGAKKSKISKTDIRSSYKRHTSMGGTTECRNFVVL